MLSLASSTWGEEEKHAILRVMDSGLFTMGREVAEFEKDFASYIGTKYAVMVNSGSSANLLMVAAYTLKHGAGTVICPALGWSTSYAPFQQYGWKLHFVDIDRETLNYNLTELWNAVEKYDDPLILSINILGNPNEYLGFPRKCHILEDNCESLGASYEGRMCGSFGLMGSHSTFFAHHICTMEGGVITTDSEEMYQMLLSLRAHGWTRHLGNKDWHFILPGYNVRPLEMMGAIGREQLKKLPGIVEVRRKNAASCPFQTQKEIGESSWYGFAFLPDDPQAFKARLDERGIEHRPVVSGNFTRHPVIRYYDWTSGKLTNADYVHDHGVMVGNHPHLIDWSIFERLPVL